MSETPFVEQVRAFIKQELAENDAVKESFTLFCFWLAYLLLFCSLFSSQSHDFSHIERVVKLALHLAAEEHLDHEDLEIVEIGMPQFTASFFSSLSLTYLSLVFWLSCVAS